MKQYSKDGHTPIEPNLNKSTFRCHDCNCLLGEKHYDGCDMDECPKCHNQLIGCGCYTGDNFPFLNEKIPYGKETRFK